MPGIDSRNIYALLGRCDSLTELAQLPENELASLLENSQTASVLYSALHSNLLVEFPTVETKGPKATTAGAGTSKPATNFRVGMKPRGAGTNRK
jgi:hypothetical protein